jgi:phosphoglycolate phosphatase
LLHACQLAHSRPEQCLYVGDAQRDIEAGNNAGMYTMVALFGYFTDQDRPHDWGANHMIEEPRELLAWLDNCHARD